MWLQDALRVMGSTPSRMDRWRVRQEGYRWDLARRRAYSACIVAHAGEPVTTGELERLHVRLDGRTLDQLTQEQGSRPAAAKSSKRQKTSERDASTGTSSSSRSSNDEGFGVRQISWPSESDKSGEHSEVESGELRSSTLSR